MDKVLKLKDQDIRSAFGSPLNLEKVRPVCTSTPVNGNRKRKNPIEDPKQLIIDAGQKNVGMVNCSEVGFDLVEIVFIYETYTHVHFSVVWFIPWTFLEIRKLMMSITIDLLRRNSSKWITGI